MPTTAHIDTSVATVTHWIAGRSWTGAVERWGDVYDPATGARTARVAFADGAG